MGNRPTTRAEAIEGFAAVLSELRDSVGRPSFRVMAGRSRVISHTTLHEAVQGNRLPSWGTTVEFVKACGADPADYRERWERANDVVSGVGTVTPAHGPVSHTAKAAGGAPTRVRVDVPIGRLAEASAGGPPRASADGGAPGAGSPGAGTGPSVTGPEAGRRRWYAVLGAVAGLVAAALVVAWFVTRSPQAAPEDTTGHVAADCPVKQQNPPDAPPAHRGDAIAFVADITLPDCGHVRRNQTLTKVWRFQNKGTLTWTGYTLHRIDLPQRRDQCQTISDVPIATTAPGQLVDVKVDVTMPTSPGFCFVRFKMMDADGKVAFPGRRPVNFQVIVD